MGKKKAITCLIFQCNSLQLTHLVQVACFFRIALMDLLVNTLSSMVATKVALRSSTRPKNVFNPILKILCSYSWMLCKHNNSSGGNSREANSFLTSCQRVGGYGVASGWCPLSTTRSDHFQLDVPFIFVKWIYKIKSGSRWKWISRMHQISFLCWNGDDIGDFRRVSRWSEPETVSSSGDSVCNLVDSV